MSKLDPWYEARARMVDAVVADLYGSDADDYLDEEPLERYIVGILHPRTATGGSAPVEVADEDPESEGGAAPDADFDPGVSFAHLRYPSTIGMTFALTEGTSSFEVEVRADRYEPVGEPTRESEKVDVVSRAYSKRVTDWRRVQVGPVIETFELTPGAAQKKEIAEGLTLRLVQRPPVGGVVNVTVVLVNTFTKPEKGRSDAVCWFRPSLRIRVAGGELADRRPDRQLTHMDADERSGELLYRAQRHLAVGHGVAVTWEESEQVREVRTTFFPSHELQLAQADRSDVTGLEMPALASAGGEDALERLIEQYESWIEREATKLPSLNADQAETARTHLSDARAAASRMRRGLQLLLADKNAAEAFRVMNLVMQQQRVRQEMIRRGQATPPDNVIGVWRPFQIAFILLNLEGLADPECDGPRSRRPAVVPHGRRQDRGLSRPDRLHARPPSPAARWSGPRRRRSGAC